MMKKREDYDYPKTYPNHLVISLWNFYNNVIFFSSGNVSIFLNILKKLKGENWYILQEQGISCTFDIGQYRLSIGTIRSAMFVRRHTRGRHFFRYRPTVLVVHSCNLTLHWCITFSHVNVEDKRFFNLADLDDFIIEENPIDTPYLSAVLDPNEIWMLSKPVRTTNFLDSRKLDVIIKNK